MNVSNADEGRFDSWKADVGRYECVKCRWRAIWLFESRWRAIWFMLNADVGQIEMYDYMESRFRAVCMCCWKLMQGNIMWRCDGSWNVRFKYDILERSARRCTQERRDNQECALDKTCAWARRMKSCLGWVQSKFFFGSYKIGLNVS